MLASQVAATKQVTDTCQSHKTNYMSTSVLRNKLQVQDISALQNKLQVQVSITEQGTATGDNDNSKL